MDALGLIIGTGTVWLLSTLVVNPLAKALTAVKFRHQYAGGSLQSANGSKKGLEIDTGYYILVDVLVLGIVGFLVGILFRWFFIGISWQAKSWPGMIAFIAFSLLGSALYG